MIRVYSARLFITSLNNTQYSTIEVGSFQALSDRERQLDDWSVLREPILRTPPTSRLIIPRESEANHNHDVSFHALHSQDG